MHGNGVNGHNGTNGHGGRPRSGVYGGTAAEVAEAEAAGVPFELPPAAPEGGPAEEPDPPEPLSRPWPDPPAPAAYSGVVGEVIRRVEPSTEADPAAILIQLLVAFGSCVGGRPAAGHWLPDPHRTNLFCVIVGKTAYGAKGQSWGWARNVMAAVDPTWSTEHVLVNGMSSAEGLIEHVQKLGDDGRVLACETEFSRILKMGTRDGNSLPECLRQGWESPRMQTAVRHNPLHVDGGHLAVVGHITGKELMGRLSQYDLHGGSFNRYLWACARRSKELPMGGPPPDLAEPVRRLRKAARSAARRGTMRLTQAAERLWRAEYGRLTGERPGAYGAATSRAHAQTLRLALVYALTDGARVIGQTHLRSALALWDYCDRSAAYVFGDGLGDRTADFLLESLRSAGAFGLGGRDLHAIFGRNRTAREIGAAMGLLLDAGLAEWREEAPGPQGGRPGKRWYAREKGSEGSGTNERTNPPPGLFVRSYRTRYRSPRSQNHRP